MTSTEYTAMSHDIAPTAATAGPCQHGLPMCATCLNDAETLLSQMRIAHATELSAMRQAHARWVDELNEAACEWADRNNLCGEFDRFMVEHGMNGRSRDYSVTVSVTMDVELTVTARNDEAAESAVDDYDVRQAIRDALSSGETPDYSVTDVTEAD